jgi:TolB-like protein/Flp pilus assembly protein TadD
MLMGEPPFTGPTPQAILARCLSGERPRMRVVRPAVPDELERVITRALAPVAADRFTSAAEFSRALAAPSTTSTAGLTGRVRAIRSDSRRSLVGTVIVLGLLSIGAALWLRGRPSGETTSTGSMRLAVLPFENLGKPEDEYFADGITEEVRGKLAAFPSFTVIARNSSSQYKGTERALPAIAKELGVQYLLTASVRWDKSGNVNRVRVSPALVRASDAATTWQQPFEAAITDVFAVQVQIAAQVAQALNVALGAEAKQTLAEKPTENLAAYDAFLKGEAAGGPGNTALGDMERASRFYEQAVALDSSFAQAWAQLARQRARQYSLAQFSDGASVGHAADRAVALAPRRPEGHFALGDYYFYVARDFVRSTNAYQEALKLAPADAELLTSLALPEGSLGRWELALDHLKRARELDPLSVGTANQYAYHLVRLQRFPEALVAADQALAMAPDNLSNIGLRVGVSLMQGDLAGARAVLRAVPNTVQPTELVVELAIYDNYWVLEDAQQRLLLRLPPSAFGGERAVWAIVRAQMYHHRGESDRARIYADTARLEFEAQLRDAPEDAQRQVILGLALAYLGRKAKAIAAGKRAAAMLPMERDAWIGAYVQLQLARIYILVDEPDKAIELLEPLMQHDLSPGMLRINPNFDPLREHPRFQRLVAGKT